MTMMYALLAKMDSSKIKTIKSDSKQFLDSLE
jgi:hypothetical protein